MQSQNSAHLPPTARRFAHLRAFGLHMLLLVLLCGVAAAVQPVAAQGESELSIELVGSIDISGSVRTVHVVGNYAYVGSEQGLQIVDISDSANLALIGNYDMQGGIYNTHVADGYAYVVGRDAGTIWILDVRDPANPTLAGSYDRADEFDGVHIAGHYAYIAAESNGLHIVDVRDPTNPILVGSLHLPGSAYDVYVMGNYAYFTDVSNGGLHIVDVQNPAAPTLISSIDTPGDASEVQVIGNYAYLAGGAKDDLYIVDMRTPTNPTLASSIEAPGITHNVHVTGAYAYLGSLENWQTPGHQREAGGLSIVDVRDPTNPMLAGSYDKIEAFDIHVVGEYVYVVDGAVSLQILRVTGAEPTAPSPAEPPPAAPTDPAQGRERCFEETGYCVQDPILTYWEQNGGLPVFGYPITERRIEQVEDQTLPVQWFERDRLEDHGDDGVLAGRLGARLLELQGRPWETFPTVDAPAEGCRYFAETRHMMCEPFLSYWEQNGGLERFGYPITETQEETLGDWTGTVQYFERRRLEHHPEHAGTAYEVLLGLLGVEVSHHTQPAEPDQLSGRIAFSSVQDGNADIWVINADGSNLTNLTNTPDINESHPAWSSDGTQIVYTVEREANDSRSDDIWVMNDDGTDQHQLQTHGTQIAYSTSGTWSPDGTWFAFSSSDPQFGGGGPPKLGVRNVDSGEVYILTDSHGLLTVEEYNTMDRDEIELPADQPMYSPDWSPDGNQIAFGTRHGSSHSWPNIWVAQWDGRESRRVTSLSWRFDPQAFDPTWSPDGRRIAFVTHELYTPEGHLKSPASSSLRIINADGTTMTTILEMEAVEFIRDPDWGPE